MYRDLDRPPSGSSRSSKKKPATVDKIFNTVAAKKKRKVKTKTDDPARPLLPARQTWTPPALEEAEGSAEMGENTRLLERDRERHYADMEAEKRAFEEHMRTQRQELAREREQMRQDLAADRLARNNALGEQRRMQKQIAEDHLHLLKRVPSGAAAGGQPRAEDLSPARLRELAMQDLSHRRPAQKSAEPAGLPGSSETEVHRLQDMTPEELRRLAAQDAIRMDANLPPPSPKSPPLLIIPPPKPSSPKMVTPPKAATPEPPKAATPEPELTAAPALETEEPPAQSLMDRDTVQDEVQGEVQHEVQATVQAKVQDEVQEKVQNEVQNEVQDEVQDRKEEEGGDEDEEEEEDVSFDMVFEMDIALFDDPDYKQKFEDEYIANMAASAGIDLSAVKLTGIRAGEAACLDQHRIACVTLLSDAHSCP
ncbi:hypothetical protein CYMTET_27803 [Cymbomonas tetramitiformis]|uniref:Uncharacterized protein n=1 Tax=Cymbomonas tetramitiformis TaxID=36881 RepID=A0AAE0KWI9_9CHLO|nr:hypothetical protein CYMTET_27803 [Cymbomonas tetramitiformis]